MVWGCSSPNGPRISLRFKTHADGGMVITIEPGMGYGDGFIMLHEEISLSVRAVLNSYRAVRPQNYR